MSKRNALFIVEGGRTEPRVIKAYMSALFHDADVEYDVYCYGTNIHKLCHAIFENGEICADSDLLTALKSQETDASERRKLDRTENKYTDIFLLFDFDPQDNGFSPTNMIKLVEYFNDSTDIGKLYINYPMLEAFRYMQKMPDDEFKERKINILECTRYKDKVERESFEQYKHLNRYTEDVWMQICKHHLKKENYILSGKYEVPNANEYIGLNQTDLLNAQIMYGSEKGEIYVLSTLMLMIFDYNPTTYIDKIQ